MSEALISIRNLQKSYGDVRAVDDISLDVAEGSLFSFLGINGAGKSTTIGILTTFLQACGGSAAIGGFDVQKNPDAIRGMIGVVFQESVLDKLLTVRENLMIRAGLYNLRASRKKAAVDAAIRLTDIGEFAGRPYGKLSGGQRRRADIARALLNSPRLLFLDEPTTGLDPKTRRDIWQMLLDLQKSTAMTIFLTTHYMEEAAASDDIVVINRGKIVAAGTPVQLKTSHCRDTLKLTLANGEYIEKTLEKTTDALPIIDSYRGQIANVEIINGTLDDVFINLTDGLSEVS